MPPEAVGGSIQTEIDRIAANVTAALTACADKGASVPDGSTSDDLAAIIAAIEAGGGGVTAVSGTFTLAADATNYTVEHGLGKTPTFAVLFQDSSYPRVDYSPFAIMHINGSIYGIHSGTSFSKSSCTADITSQTPISKYNTGRFVHAIHSATSDSIVFGYHDDNAAVTSNGYGLKASTPYYWIVGYEE